MNFICEIPDDLDENTFNRRNLLIENLYYISDYQKIIYNYSGFTLIQKKPKINEHFLPPIYLYASR